MGTRSRLKIVIILGTRPQIIKSAPVLKAFDDTDCDCGIINTGQHYDYEMNKEFFEELQLPDPEVNLEVGQGSANDQISRIIAGLEKHLAENRPDLAIIPGDTNSTLAGGIACSKLGIKIAHLEAGCRSNDFRMSEEINRRILDHISQVLLCPTPLCRRNLERENVMAGVIENVGDTMYDSLLKFANRIDQSDVTRRLKLSAGLYVFMTTHRAENVDDQTSLSSVLDGVDSFDIPVVFPVHPRTKAKLHEFKAKIPKNVFLIDPLPYFDSLRLVKDSKLVVTDSGGLQKEAYWLGKKAIILRDNTEWMEIIDAGGGILTGCSEQRIKEAYRKIVDAPVGTGSSTTEIFGAGHASERVADVICNFLGSNDKTGR